MPLRFCICSLAAFALTVTLAMSAAPTQTHAQSITKPPSSGISPFRVRPSRGRQKGVEISVSYQFFLSGEATKLEEQARLSEQGRRALYTLLGRECDTLLETIARSCEITRANVNSQINRSRSATRRGIRVSGSATYRIEFKPRQELRPTNEDATQAPSRN